MRILFASPEVAPFAKTGGLADVAGALPRALAGRGHHVDVVMPLYRCARAVGDMEPTPLRVRIPLGGREVEGGLSRGRLPKGNVPVWLVEQRELFERDDAAAQKGLYQYRMPSGRLENYEDNSQRFIFFCRAVCELIPLLDAPPDIVHVNDWQTGLVPVYLKELYGKRSGFPRPKSLLTLHNLAYQGLFWHWDMLLTGLDWGLFNWRQLEFYGKLSFLKGGIVFADALNTVSPRYAEEIQTPEFGCGLEGTLAHHRRKLSGIVNGVDYEEWDPRHDPHLPVPYGPDTVGPGKAACKARLQETLKLPRRPDVPLIGMVTRLTEQKGLDLLQEAALELLRWDVQLTILGVGEVHYHQFLIALRGRFADRLAVVLEFNEPLAHLIEGGADMFLMPSRFEPSGLNQLYSLRYGTPPIVRAVGGLADTVAPYTPEALTAGTATGFSFTDYTPEAMLEAVRRAVILFRESPAAWRQLQRNGMAQDWSWQRSAAAYEVLYEKLAQAPAEAETGAGPGKPHAADSGPL